MILNEDYVIFQIILKTIRHECLTKTVFVDFDNADKQIKSYINFYNTKRFHSSLLYLTSEDYFLGKDKERIKVRCIKLNKAKSAIKVFYQNSIFFVA
jgi:hypothetical protein